MEYSSCSEVADHGHRFYRRGAPCAHQRTGTHLGLGGGFARARAASSAASRWRSFFWNSSLRIETVPTPATKPPSTRETYAAAVHSAVGSDVRMAAPSSHPHMPIAGRPGIRSRVARSAITRARSSMLTSSSRRAAELASESRIAMSCKSASRPEPLKVSNQAPAANRAAATMAPTPSHSEKVMSERYRE